MNSKGSFLLPFGLGFCVVVCGCGGGSSTPASGGSVGSTGSGSGSTTGSPSVASVAPAETTAGSAALTLTVSGSGFISTSVVEVGGIAETTAYVSATQLTAVVPAAQMASGAQLPVTVMNGTVTSASATLVPLYVRYPLPKIGSITPDVETTGTASPVITVSGADFFKTTVIQVNGAARPTTFGNATMVTVALTAADVSASGTLALTAVNPSPGGGVSSAVSLTVSSAAAAAPVLTSVTPNSFVAGSQGTTITLAGTGFTSGTVAQWGGKNLDTTYLNATALTAAVPATDLATAGTASVTVSAPTAVPAVSNAVTINITSSTAPKLASITPNSGPINTAATLTLAGTGFTALSSVTMNGSAATCTLVSSEQLTCPLSASTVAFPGNVNVAVTNSAQGEGTAASLPYTAYVSIPNSGMVYNSVNGLLYISVPSSAGPPFGNSVVSVDPATGALGKPILVGSEPDALAVSSDGTTLWVGLDGTSAVREVNLATGAAGMQFSLGNNSGVYAFPPLAHALAVLPGYPNSIVMSSEQNPYLYQDALGIYDSGVLRSNVIALSTLATLPAIAVSPTKAEIYATSYDTGYDVLSYNATGLQPLAGNSGTYNFSATAGTAVQIDNGVAYLDSGVALNAETGALLGTFYSSGTTVATGPMVSDSILGKLFILENTTSQPLMVQAFHESNFTPIASDNFQVNGAVSGAKYGAGYDTETSLNGLNPINTMVRWGSDGIAFRAANGVFSFRSNLVKDLSAVTADLSVSLAASGSSTTGGNTTYTARIRNAGASGSAGVALTAAVPSTGLLLSASASSGTCSVSGAVSCNLGSLASGSTVSVTFVISQQTSGASTLGVQVFASENDPDLSNNQASATVTVTGNDINPAPTVASVTPAAILAGSQSTEITVSGTGFTSASEIVVGGTPLATAAVSSTQLTATVPDTDLASLGWTTVSVATPAPGGGNSNALPLTIFKVMPLGANHILFDPFSQKIMASISSDATTSAGNSLLAITPGTATAGTPISIGSQPTNMALTSDGQILYTVLSGSESIARFNMLTQTVGYTYALQPGTGTDSSPAPRGIATQPGNENTVAIDLGSWAGNAIYQFDPANQTASMVGQASGPYSGSCLNFLDAGNLLGFDTDTTGATLDHYTVTPAGFTYYDYGQATQSTLNGFGCFKLNGGLAFGIGGGVANPATQPATQVGLFPVNTDGTFNNSLALAPDMSLQTAFFAVSSPTQPNSYGPADSIEAFSQNSYMPISSLFLDMKSIEGNSNYTAVDMIRWGQDGLALLTSDGNLYLLRGAFVVPQLLNASAAATLTSNSLGTLAHGSGNTVLTLTGSNFLPGLAVTWNGNYRTTTIVDPQHVTVDVPASDLASSGTASLVATNPGATGSNALQVTIQ